jgi:hypothetical protein
MPKRIFPELTSTGRRYLAETQRARLASPGLERFEVKRWRAARRLAVAALALAALLGVLAWLARG